MYTDSYPLPDWGLFGLNGKFLNVYVETTLACPNHCPFCMYRDIKPAGTMPMADYLDILPQLDGITENLYVCCAGESLVLENLPERIAAAQSACPNARIHLVTSAAIERTREYFTELFKAGLNVLHISCYGHTKEDYEKIHGRDAFDTVQANLRFIAELSPRYNIDVSFEFLNDGAKHFNVDNAEMKKRRFIHEHVQQATVMHKEIFSNPGQQNMEVDGSVIASPIPCATLWTSRAGFLSITWDLDVIPCPYLRGKETRFGNLREMNLREIFASESFLRFRKKQWAMDLTDMATCQSCTFPNMQIFSGESLRYVSYCAAKLAGKEVYFWGCGEAYRMYGQLFAQSKPRCFLCDTTNSEVVTVDGIPVLDPESVLRGGDILPIVIFAYPQHSRKILNNIYTNFPYYTKKDIVLSMPSLNEWFG